MRVLIKGGVWKNTEDEILKAAVMKYGKNQWARISSLLVRKSPKQCKARWYEWLDPSIKKTEWSKEEDEKLLHLAKLMPTQWRTIAPIVGRTASQCLERYQQLLDEAEQKEGADLGLTGVGDTGPSADDVRRLRPGEIDPDPETKAARPDPVDMDEDEKEMLSEARARLANTQGKKAKRKAREKQLEEARRLAALQKRRELKAAGIDIRVKKKTKGMDYNADIPLEKKPAPGFYDTTEEKERPVQRMGSRLDLQKLEGKRRAEVEAEERKKDAKKQKQRKENGETSFVPGSSMQLNKLNEAQQLTRRKKLLLPSPQVGESELEEIVKIGIAGENARSIAEESSVDATRGLLGTYSTIQSGLAARTPRTPAAADTVMMEARNLRALSSAQTPLLGGENTPLIQSATGTGFQGATPRHAPAQTPNPLLTPLRSASGASTGFTTPGRGNQAGATPLRTPFRDELSINADGDGGFVEGTPRAEKMRLASVRKQVSLGLANLPAPKNEFEIRLPEEATDDVSGDLAPSAMEEDAADADKRRKELRLAQKQAELRRRTQVIQRQLPRPMSINAEGILGAAQDEQDELLRQAQHMISEELVSVLAHDQAKFPFGNGQTSKKVNLEQFTDDELHEARVLIKQESEKALGGDENSAINMEEFAEIWERTSGSYIYAPSLEKYVKSEDIGEGERIASMSDILEKNRKKMGKEAARAAKVEKKLNVVLGGYQARSEALVEKLTAAYEELDQVTIELSSFRNLNMLEKVAIPQRIHSIQSQVHHLTNRETELQKQYANLSVERQDIQERINQLQAHNQANNSVGA
ncbi:Cc.Cdc5 protein [Basidiobolus meristosporus CBS 931.73]|uniref:Cc.Cdc5 protein n=1 Tax=Basidiobolus meristosporus CBS 931.73 TaxID=1314790 RepID=A0A1Y1YID3_9FUNG|nr:Cc.Cdc5 protein [Basidiobolus meristosporus CBS 931.73]|eukprot:ORX97739.1 Cc.Cdc5 protein [Basidiobolus meristosporus CBS 931.73]